MCRLIPFVSVMTVRTSPRPSEATDEPPTPLIFDLRRERQRYTSDGSFVMWQDAPESMSQSVVPNLIVFDQKASSTPFSVFQSVTVASAVCAYACTAHTQTKEEGEQQSCVLAPEYGAGNE